MRLEVDAPPGLPLMGDEDRLKQALLNLVLNGAQAQPRGGLVRMRARGGALGVVFEVEDQGGGIPEEIVDKVFDSFFTTKPTGTGLGLSICYRIVTDHGGAITIGGRSGNVSGTCVTITLPIMTGR